MLRFLLLIAISLLVTGTLSRFWWDESESSSESNSKRSSSTSGRFESDEESESRGYWWQSSRLCRRCKNRYDKCIEGYDICQFKLERCKIRQNCNKGNSLPTKRPTKRRNRRNPTYNPTMMSQKTGDPTMMTTKIPSKIPTSKPTISPLLMPSPYPSEIPTISPIQVPSLHPSFLPSSEPTPYPSEIPSTNPSENPSQAPSLSPSFFTLSPTTPTQNPTSPCSNTGCGCYVYFYEEQDCVGSPLSFVLQVDLSILRSYRRDFLPVIWPIERNNMSFQLVYGSSIDQSCCTLLAECNPGAYPIPWQTSESHIQECVNFRTIDLTCLVLIEQERCF